MTGKTIELRVGLVVVLAIAILVVGIIWVKGIRFNQTKYRYSVILPNVGALKVGDPVSVSGVEKGKVKKIQLYEGDVLVTLDLGADVVLKKDAKFTVKNIGLMGERFVDVQTGYSDTLLDLSQPVRGYYDTGIPEVMGRVGEMIDQLSRLVANLEGVLGTKWSRESMIETIKNLREISHDMNALLDRNKGKFDQTMDDLSYTSAELKKIIDQNKEKLQTTVDGFEQASVKLDNVVTSLDTISISLKKLTYKIEKGEGTLGQLVNDTTLYEQIKKTTQHVDSLILDIKKNPKKYLKITVF
ncbi:MAG: MCE family protein [candidate division Zixibacteria bacterium]|nr:MCE family protein [candidate division Zixibacteria bacterium]